MTHATSFDEVLAKHGNPNGPALLLRVTTPSADWSGAIGRHHLPDGRQAQPEDAFRIASVTKLITALAVLRLCDAGKLELDATIDLVAPAAVVNRLPRGGEKITIRQLLAHRSGLRNYFDTGFLERLGQNAALVWTPLELLAIAAEAGPSDFEPNEGFRYGDTAYVVAGLIIEARTGLDLDAAYRRLVLDEVGAGHTFLETSPAPLDGPVHHYQGDFDLTALHPAYDWAGGGLVSTAADLEHILRAALAGDLLSPASRAALLGWRDDVEWAPNSTARYDRYGLGLGVMELNGVELVGTTGVWGAFALSIPALDTVLTGSTNTTAADRPALLADLVRAVAAELAKK